MDSLDFAMAGIVVFAIAYALWELTRSAKHGD